MNLRDYQSDLINKTRYSFTNHKRVLSVAPCGAGKTVMFAWMSEQHLKKNPNGCVWFLVHRQELIDQTIDTFKTHNISMDNVIIAMVQTVTRHITEYPKPSLIIFDEAHHATAKTWTNILDYYCDVPVVGLTATPARLDGRPLGDIFDDMQIGVSANWLIDHNYLSPYKYFAPHIDIEEAAWQIKGADYDMDSVAKTMDKQAIYGDVLKYIDVNKKTIIYAPNIAFSERLSNIINNRFGDICRHFDGNTDKSIRKQIIDDFRTGKIRILTNVNLIGEGFDCPSADCCMLLRPTMSVSLYIQQAMRCMRYKENKTAIIYDFVGNVYKHGMPTDDREWSLNKSVKMRNKSEDRELLVRECKHCFRVYKGNARICPYCGADNGKTRKQIEEDKKHELEEIKELERKKQRKEVGMCQTLEQLVQLGIKRNYSNPRWWAQSIINARNKKI